MYQCDYCNNSFTSYRTYMYKHKCKFTQANRLMRSTKKVHTFIDELHTTKRMDSIQHIKLSNKISHETLVIVSKIMNSENITH